MNRPLTDLDLKEIASLGGVFEANREEHAARAVRLLLGEVKRLKAAVREHHDQRVDDRCHLDDVKLYHALLGEGVDPYAGALPPDEDMLESCRRYIRQRRCPGPQGVVPLPGDMTIAQLTAEVERLKAENANLVSACNLALPFLWNAPLEGATDAFEAVRTIRDAAGVFLAKEGM